MNLLNVRFLQAVTTALIPLIAAFSLLSTSTRLFFNLASNTQKPLALQLSTPPSTEQYPQHLTMEPPNNQRSLCLQLKRRAEAPPSDGIEPAQKTRRIDADAADAPSPPNTTVQTPPPTPKTLPTEIWMQILESVDHSDHIARPSYVNCFVQAIIQDRATEAQLVPLLPTFEKEAWKATRPYYAIDRTSRQAAHQVFLSGVLLQTCPSPLNQVPLKRTLGRREPHAARTSIPPPFYAPTALAKMCVQTKAVSSTDNDNVNATTASSTPHPTYIPLELFDLRLFHEANLPDNDPKLPITLRARVGFLAELFDQHFQRLIQEDATLLKSVRRVDLLAAAPYEELMGQARLWADVLRAEIEGFWKGMGIEGAVVRVLH